MALPKEYAALPTLEYQVLKAVTRFSLRVVTLRFLPHTENNIQIKGYTHANCDFPSCGHRRIHGR
jgi:hypothetical protein